MKARTAVLGVTAACAACCSVPLIAAATASAGLVGVGSAWLGWSFSLALIAAAVAAFAFASVRRRSTMASCQPEGCGCGSASDTAINCDNNPIACSLGADDFKQRSAWIHELARKHLRQSQRTPLTLDLTYAPQAAPQVREMVAKEQTCCSFLRFDLREEPDAVRLTITAPERAREAADVLFDHFAPGASAATGSPLTA